MVFVLIILAILVFYWYYRTWEKQDFLNSATRGAKGSTRGFARGAVEERIDEFKECVNYYTIALLAKIAKSGGRVNKGEAEMVSRILDANAKDERGRAFLKASFNEHEENVHDASYAAEGFLKEIPLPKNERFNVLRVLVFMALIDADFSAKRHEILKQTTKTFDITESEPDDFITNISNLESTKEELNLDEAYHILEFSNNTNLNTVKKQYRALTKEYHPDVLNAGNVSEEELKKGVEKFRKINEAYKKVKKYLEK